MKRLTLVRHAKSSWANPGTPDRDRQLAARGERDSRKMGRRLVARKARPSLILSSPAVRAHETAKAIAAALKYPSEFLQLESEIYLATSEEITDLVRLQRDDFSDLMIVGHNPGLTDLVNELLPEFQLENLPTGGVVAIDLDAEHWSKILEKPAELVYYDYPKNPEVLVIEN
ncbi:MAG: histidine phosphatase family protein [Gammaproteobacteria bacterium]|nr:histidine phosphatase family protein [Gammaproteobacteria bacterium]